LPASNCAATRAPAASVVRSTVDSLSRKPAIFRNARSAPWAKLPNKPAIATISSDAAVNDRLQLQGTPKVLHRQCRQ
jgi:hypothetical protein